MKFNTVESKDAALSRKIYDRQPAVASCIWCPEFSVEGTAEECRAAAARHREEKHPDLHVKKRAQGSLATCKIGSCTNQVAQRNGRYGGLCQVHTEEAKEARKNPASRL